MRLKEKRRAAAPAPRPRSSSTAPGASGSARRAAGCGSCTDIVVRDPAGRRARARRASCGTRVVRAVHHARHRRGVRLAAGRQAAHAERAGRPRPGERGGDAARRCGWRPPSTPARPTCCGSPSRWRSTGSASAPSRVVAEAMECLGGNGYVEEHGLARLFRDSPVASLWEGTGNVNALDVLRAMSLQPRVDGGPARRGRPGPRRRPAARPGDGRGGRVPAGRRPRGAPRPGRGRGRRTLDGGAARRRPAGVAAGAVTHRRPVSSAFLATRVAGGGGALFGTLPVGRRTTQTIVDRALPG